MQEHGEAASVVASFADLDHAQQVVERLGTEHSARLFAPDGVDAPQGDGVWVALSTKDPSGAEALLREQGATDVMREDEPWTRGGVPTADPKTAQRRVGDSQIEVGLEVVGADYEPIGRVKRVEGDELLIDRPAKRDVWVPLSSVAKRVGDWLVLDLTADAVDPLEPLGDPRISRLSSRPD